MSAPPPVLTWSRRPGSMKRRALATVSPPPMTVVASVAAHAPPGVPPPRAGGERDPIPMLSEESLGESDKAPEVTIGDESGGRLAEVDPGGRQHDFPDE